MSFYCIGLSHSLIGKWIYCQTTVPVSEIIYGRKSRRFLYPALLHFTYAVWQKMGLSIWKGQLQSGLRSKCIQSKKVLSYRFLAFSCRSGWKHSKQWNLLAFFTILWMELQLNWLSHGGTVLETDLIFSIFYLMFLINKYTFHCGFVFCLYCH